MLRARVGEKEERRGEERRRRGEERRGEERRGEEERRKDMKLYCSHSPENCVWCWCTITYFQSGRHRR